MFLNKKMLLMVSIVLVVFLFSCSNKVKNEQLETVLKRSDKPETGLKPVEPVLIKYSFDNIPDGKLFEFDGNIEIEIKIMPDTKDQKKFITIPTDFNFSGSLSKTGKDAEGTLFNFKIAKLSINTPGPGVNVDYNSGNNEKHLNPQIKILDSIIGKEIPIKTSDFGLIGIDFDLFFKENESLKSILTDEYLEKIRIIIGYFFLNYPESAKKIGQSFSSQFPFEGEYAIDSLTKNKLNTLIIPKNPKSPDKKVLSSSLKGWIFINNNTGILNRSFLQFTEKKYMKYNDLKTLIEKNILIDLKVIEK